MLDTQKRSATNLRVQFCCFYPTRFKWVLCLMWFYHYVPRSIMYWTKKPCFWNNKTYFISFLIAFKIITRGIIFQENVYATDYIVCFNISVQHYGLYQMTNNVMKYTDEQYKAIYNYRKMIDINQITVSEVRHGYIN